MAAVIDSDNQNLREIKTPEGIPLRLELATKGQRIGAFLVDFSIIIAAIIAVLVLTAIVVVGPLQSSLPLAFTMIAIFLFRNFYFVISELKLQGRTLGKKLVNTRVIDAGGGSLSAQQVFARNVTREIELFLPLIALMVPEAVLPGSTAWSYVLSGAWLLVLSIMPLLNKNRMRVGDFIAGTLVVQDPPMNLLRDIGQSSRRGEKAEPRYTFTKEQLDMYGIYELQILEDFLRSTTDMEAMRRVARQIIRKINFKEKVRHVDIETFLQDFYRAQRHRLEQKMVVKGERVERKKMGRLSD
ncbi:MAG: RDD family protein [Myxococcota bacterium]